MSREPFFSSVRVVNMAEFVTVAKVGDIPEGEGRAYPVQGKMIAIFLVDGEYLAINDFCPHMGASLSAGYVEEGAVTCPWHAWRFRLCDGLWLDNPKSSIKTDCYRVQVINGEIQVSLSKAADPENGPENLL